MKSLKPNRPKKLNIPWVFVYWLIMMSLCLFIIYVLIEIRIAGY